MTFRGHKVLRTLIRCHFSPLESTGQSYIYSGSADGRIHIWSLDGRVVQVLNRAEARPLHPSDAGGYTDPSAEERTRARRLGASIHSQGTSYTVRDVAWHSRTPTLMSTCWELEGRYRDGRGSIAMHEWKGLGKGGLKSLEDWVEKNAQEGPGRAAEW
jgi:WD repeat-containing protein 23